jgi:hypothetical protein
MKPDMTLLEALYRGQSGFLGEMHISSAKYSKALDDMIVAEQKLRADCPECINLLEAFRDAQVTLNSITEYEQFLLGFRAGAQLMLEMLGPLK